MICKNILLGALLVAFCAGHLKAEEENVPEDTIDAAEMINVESDYTDEELEELEDIEAAQIMADAIVESAKIVSNGIIAISQIVAEKQVEAAEKFGLEAAKRVADAIVETAKIVSEKQVEAAEKFGLEATKITIEAAQQWAPVAKAIISTFGMLVLFSIFR